MTHRIILTVTSDLNTDQRMQRICMTLHNYGYDVLLIGRKLSKQNKIFSFPSKRISCLFNKGFLFYAEYNLRLFLFLLFNKMDVICSIDLDTILPGRMVCRLRNKRHIYDAHEFFTESPELDGRLGVKRFWEWIGRMSVPFIDAGYTVNYSISKLLKNKYDVDFSVIRNLPMRQNENVASLTTTDSYLLYQGVLNKGRGIEELIESMVMIEEIPLFIAGSGDLHSKLEKKVFSLGLQTKVRFLGKLSPEELRKVTQGATIGFNLLNPENKNYFYSLANKFFDYIIADVPSISMDFPEYRKINDEIEISVLIKDLDITTISNAIKSLLKDQENYDRLKSNCKKAASIYNWANEEKALISFYQKILPTQ